MLAKVLDVLAVGEKPFLMGGAGSGKTTIGVQAAEALDTNFYSTGAVMDKFELLGYSDAAGHYHRTPLRDAVEFGGVFLWDEIDASDAGALVAFNAMLENGFVAFPDNVTLHIDFTKTHFIASANTIGRGANRVYVGRNALDAATLDRWTQLEVDYDRGIEYAMARNAWRQGGGDDSQLAVAEAWANTVRELRDTLESRGILALVTPRATRQGAKLLARGWAKDDVIKTCLHKHLSADQIRQLSV